MYLFRTVACLSVLSALPALAGEPPVLTKVGTQSLSLGTPTRGWLENGRRLAQRGRNYQVIPITRERGFGWGTTELVELIPRVAARVARKHRGAVLQVGNLSRKSGGDIPQSVTHNSGRDADLLFYARDGENEPVVVTAFLRYDKRGRAGTLRFDVARNWSLVRALVSDKGAVVQSILVARHLKRMLLAHARRAKAPAWVIARAQAVLHQPSRAAPHDDHFHIRVYCAQHERLSGCLNRGQIHPWAQTWDVEVAARAKVLATVMRGSDTKAAVDAARLLELLRATRQTDALQLALADRRLLVQRQALRSLRRMRQLKGSSSSILKAAKLATDAVWRFRLVRILVDNRASESEQLLARLIHAGDTGSETRMLATRGLGYLGSRAALPAMFLRFRDRNAKLRSATADALQRITGFSFGTGSKAEAQWNAWWQKHRRSQRLSWLWVAMEERLALSIDAIGCKKAIRRMLSLIKTGGIGSENARALIAGLTGFERKGKSARQLYRRYRRWYRKGGARQCRKSALLATVTHLKRR